MAQCYTAQAIVLPYANGKEMLNLEYNWVELMKIFTKIFAITEKK